MCVLLSLAAISCLSQKKIDFLVPGSIPLLKQPKDMDCWITVTTMMVSWKDGKRYSVDEIARRLGDPWKQYYEMNLGLPDIDVTKFLNAVKMKGEPPANYTIKAYLDLMNDYGPVWITTGDGLSAHARLLIGMKGDSSYQNMQFILIDPKDGTRLETDALVFLKEFEEEAKIANKVGWEKLRIQLYHF